MDAGVDRDDWLALPDEDLRAEEELRLAVVLNGGVSLAVWMGGVVLEVQRLTRRDGVYGRLLSALNSRARVDVIAGTSAGGINGGALAVGQVYRDADVGALRDVWAREGSLYDLLQDPWSGQPASLLKGDAAFLPALRSAFADLVGRGGPQGSGAYSPDDRPILLTLTATLLTAEARMLTDALGAAVSQPSHAGRMTFRRLPHALARPGQDNDQFAPGTVGLADRLALAARCTASFPVAFEPVLVPIGASADRGAPDMAGHANFRQSRWVVDGGVLMNTPLAPVLEAIVVAPAGLQVRRALLLVVPDPYLPSGLALEPDRPTDRPTVAGTLGRIIKSVESQTVAEELRLLEEHNMRALARRESRTDLLETVTSGPKDAATDLGRMADTLFPSYRSIRIARAARTIAEQATLGQPGAAAEQVGVRQQSSEMAQELRRLLRDQPELPFTPTRFADGLLGGVESAAVANGAAPEPDAGPAGQSPSTAPVWNWGLAPLERLGIAVQDLLKRAMWVLQAGPDREAVAALRERHAEAGARVMALRRADSEYWRRWGTQVGSRPLADALAEGLLGWGPTLQAAMPGTTMAGIARDLVDIGHEAALLVPARAPHPDPLLEFDRLRLLQSVFGAEQANARMVAVLGLEVCYLSLVETDDVAANEQFIELVRISADGDQPFAPGLRAADRVAGLRLGHFAAFLKQSWRINDWIWGRLDAANRLVTLLVDPPRLRRLVLLAGPPDGVPDPTQLAEGGLYVGSAAARGVLERILGAPPLAGQWLDVLRVLDGLIPLSEAGPVVKPLVDQLVTELADQIVREEEPALLTAVRMDALDGENPSSAGTRWLRSRFPGQAVDPAGTLVSPVGETHQAPDPADPPAAGPGAAQDAHPARPTDPPAREESS